MSASNSGRRFIAALAVALCVTQPAAAQGDSHAFDALSRALRPGDSLFVTTRSAGELRGQFVRVSTEAITLASAGRERTIPLIDIGRVEKRGDPVKNGALIGAGILGFAMMGGAGASCSPHCESAVWGGLLGGVALGAGIGALIDGLVPGRTTVYRNSSEPTASPGVAAPAAVAPTVPAAAEHQQSFASLWTRVNSGDRVTIRTTATTDVVGRFAQVSDSSVTVRVGDDARVIPVAEVTQVIRHRGGTHVKKGLAIGIPVGLLAGSTACYRVEKPWQEPGDSGVSCGAGILLGAAAGGAVGALLGHMTYGQTVVYSATPGPGSASVVSTWSDVRLAVVPMVAPHRLAVVASCSF